MNSPKLPWSAEYRRPISPVCRTTSAAWPGSHPACPDSVRSNTITNQCPSGMSATMHAARAIMTGETDIMIAAGVEDMDKVPMGSSMNFPPRLLKYYNGADLLMGATAEKVAELWAISREDMDNMAAWSNQKAAEAKKAGKFKNEIVPVMGMKEDGTPFLVEHDQWIRDKVDRAKMAAMQSNFKADGQVTAANASPLTQGACALLMMSRKKADELGLAWLPFAEPLAMPARF